jgi:acetyltransferase-like isoleucine patch superfamily enzyme
VLLSLIRAIKGINNYISNYQCYYYKKLYAERFLFTVPPTFGNNFFIDLKDDSRTEFHGTFKARGNFSLIGRKAGKIEIGNNVFFNLGGSLSCLDAITIGNNVMFGENVKIYDHNHEYKNKDVLFCDQGYSIAPVSIGNNCWIGTNVVILKGITIGDNVVVGANVVVIKSIESNQVVFADQKLMNKEIQES